MPARPCQEIWRGLDSNQRRRKPTDLQSVPFSHSGTPPHMARARAFKPVRAPLSMSPARSRHDLARRAHRPSTGA